jgi:hypothetical protein
MTGGGRPPGERFFMGLHDPKIAARLVIVDCAKTRYGGDVLTVAAEER